MKKLFFLIPLFFAGCDQQIHVDFGEHGPTIQRPAIKYPAYQTPYPTVDIIEAFRQQNWRGRKGEGSCVHASMVMLFRWQGQHELADKWRETYGDGEWDTNLARKFDAEGVRYAYTSQQKDVKFLQWACQTRRGCGVTVMGGAHMVCLVHLDDKWAGILDNNYIDKIKWVPREQFLTEWMNSSSWAVTPVYTPPAPLPCR